jgi:hypothetical protein
MCADASGKHVILDNIMDQYVADIGHDALPDLEWHSIDDVSTFLRAPRQVMESLAVNHKPTLDLVPMSVSLLLKHCDDNEQKLQEIDSKMTTVGMKAKLEKYKSKLVQEPAIIAAYLNPQIPKPTDSAELKLVVSTIRCSAATRPR